MPQKLELASYNNYYVILKKAGQLITLHTCALIESEHMVGKHMHGLAEQ